MHKSLFNKNKTNMIQVMANKIPRYICNVFAKHWKYMKTYLIAIVCLMEEDCKLHTITIKIKAFLHL